MRDCVLASANGRALDGPDDRANDPMLVDQADPVSDRATSVGRANQVIGHYVQATENMRKISPAEFATATNGRIGGRITATTSVTIGAITPATTTIGSATNGGFTITFTTCTTQTSIIGQWLPGRR